MINFIIGLNFFSILLLLYLSFNKKDYLFAFYLVVINVPMVGFLSIFFADNVIFWPSMEYSFDKDSSIIWNLMSVWVLGVLGAYSGYLVSLGVREIKFFSFSGICVSKSDTSVFFGVVFFLTIVLTLFLLLDYVAFTELLSGALLMIISGLVFVFGWTYYFKSKMLSVSILLLVVFVTVNAYNADRDFVVLLAAIFMFKLYADNNNIKIIKLLMWSFVVVFIAVSISLTRMGMSLSAGTLAGYFAFNSWNAVVLPMIDMFREYKLGFEYLYGKTYVDMFVSSFLSLYYSVVGDMKPIYLDNPALWYYKEGMGGMYSYGVAFKNFGFFGVYIYSFILSLLVGLLSYNGKKIGFIRLMFIAFFSSALMHGLWYGEVVIFNILKLMIVWLIMVAFFLVVTGCYRRN